MVHAALTACAAVICVCSMFLFVFCLKNRERKFCGIIPITFGAISYSVFFVLAAIHGLRYLDNSFMKVLLEVGVLFTLIGSVISFYFIKSKKPTGKG